MVLCPGEICGSGFQLLGALWTICKGIKVRQETLLPERQACISFGKFVKICKFKKIEG